MMRVILVVAFLAATVGTAHGQDQPVSFVPFEGTVRSLRGLKTTGDTRIGDIASILLERSSEFAIYSFGREVYASLVEEGRLDKQIGASSSGPGSTTLVSRGSVPALIGVAVENGALYQAVNGSAVTFRLNPAGLARAVAKRSYLLSAAPVNATALEQGLSNLAVSASFDLQKGSSPGTFTGERSQLTEVTARYHAINKRDPRHPAHRVAIQQLSGNLAGTVVVAQSYVDVLRKAAGYDAWRVETAKRLAGIDLGNDRTLRDTLVAIGDEFTRLFAVNPDLQRLSHALVGEIKTYRGTRDATFKAIDRSSVLTFEYAFNRMTIPEAALSTLPADFITPDLSTARVIFSSSLGTVGEATVNGSVTVFNKILAGMDGRLRDVQVSGSLEFKLPEIEGVGRLVLTLAGLGAFLQQQPFGVPVRIKDVETTDGTIGVFQAKVTMPAGASGVKIPLSMTLANRSEFNTGETEVRGAIGLSFDFDTLFARRN